ncbi:uncharacterized protein LOC123690191 [Pieris rapae]|uniref:uncharacterized protein LOC123690191 n=1 Tax=Pieris rapae TaxID=64459 RepID=UPI001E27DD95|nr:uncharacterized protein LOC123690191 [Pieris rapae]
MRSPNDTTDDYSKMFYQANIFDDDEILKENDTSLCRRIAAFFFGCLRKKADNFSDEAFAEIEQLSHVPRKLYSFTELELRNIAPVIKDAGVQTGSSLEISRETSVKQKTSASFKMSNEGTSEKQKKSILDSRTDPITQNTNRPRRNSELNLLQLIRNLNISDSDSSNKTETEINNTVYEKPVEISYKTKDKHLRFDEEIVTIPRNDTPESSEHTIDDEKPGTSKEFKGFWRSGKKKQKKSRLPLR